MSQLDKKLNSREIKKLPPILDYRSVFNDKSSAEGRIVKSRYQMIKLELFCTGTGKGRDPRASLIALHRLPTIRVSVKVN